MTILRPVSSRLPVSRSVQDDTGLPLSAVLLPYGRRTELSSSTSSPPRRDDGGDEHDDDGGRIGQTDDGTAATQSTNGGTAVAASAASPSTPPPVRHPHPPPASLLTRCTKCGAPAHPDVSLASPSYHPRQRRVSSSRSRSSSSSMRLLCGLCGSTFDASAEAQYDARRKRRQRRRGEGGGGGGGGEWTQLDREAYRLRPLLLGDDDYDGDDGRDAMYDDYYGGGSWDDDGDGDDIRTRGRKARRRISEYSLPLIEFHRGSDDDGTGNAARDGGIYSDVDDENDSVMERLYELPAAGCPPILLFLIDGTSKSGSYYRAVSRSIEAALLQTDGGRGGSGHDEEEDPPPPGAQWGILVLTERGNVTALDLSSIGAAAVSVRNGRCVPVVDASGGDDVAGGDALDYDEEWYHRGRDNQEGEEDCVPLADLLDPPERRFRRCDSAAADNSNGDDANAETEPLMGCFATLRERGGAASTSASAALRALEDHAVLIDRACRRDRPGHGGGVHLGGTLHALLDAFEDRGLRHPGMSNDDDDGDETLDARYYAGGKLVCFLSGPPAELRSASALATDGRKRKRRRTGYGGFGGACAEEGRRYASDPAAGAASKPLERRRQLNLDDDDPEAGGGVGRMGTFGYEEDDEITVGGEEDNDGLLVPESPEGDDVDSYFHELGVRCATAALGVEVFFVLPCGSDSGDSSYDDSWLAKEVEGEGEERYLGVPTLRLLSERSGGGGPLLARVRDRSGWDGSKDVGEWNGGEVLASEVRARCPWGRPMAFGAILRLRFTPTLAIDRTPLDPGDIFGLPPGMRPQPVHLHSNNGMDGPASVSPDNDDLWILGSSDEHTTLSFDFNVVSASGAVETSAHVDGWGDVTLAPALQSCFAYTAIVRRQATRRWVTVRRLRVLTATMAIASDAESITGAMDVEALSVVLFHKLVSTSLQDGLAAAQALGRNWLVSTLVCAYRSAEEHEMRSQLRESRGLAPSEVEFYPNERLLERGGQLSENDILLARGHSRLEALPLLVFSLLQCDALRPSGGTFSPTVDARCAAAANAASMPPGALARMIAPRIEVWIAGEKTSHLLADNVGMSMEALRLILLEIQGEGGDKSSGTLQWPVVLLDSPCRILVLSSRHFLCPDATCGDGDTPFDVTLQRVVGKAAKSYRCPPQIQNFLGNHNGLVSVAPQALFQDSLVEDSASNAMSNYAEWSTGIAELVHEELAEDE